VAEGGGVGGFACGGCARGGGVASGEAGGAWGEIELDPMGKVASGEGNGGNGIESGRRKVNWTFSTTLGTNYNTGAT